MVEQLEPTESIINAVLASIPDAVIVVNPKNRIIRNCNSATEKIFGYKKDNLIGRSTEQLHIDQRAHEIFGELSEKDLRHGEIFQGEFEMKRKDGTIINTYHTVRPIKEELGWQRVL